MLSKKDCSTTIWSKNFLHPKLLLLDFAKVLHLKDYANSIDFEIPVDKEYFDSVEKGTKIVDKFRFGSFVLYGSFGDWEMTVKEKVVR
jgi:hypothetical protein